VHWGWFQILTVIFCRRALSPWSRTMWVAVTWILTL
jgi:hypothetical protein